MYIYENVHQLKRFIMQLISLLFFHLFQLVTYSWQIEIPEED